MNKYQAQVNGCKSLSELADTLNNIASELGEKNETIDNYVDTAALPTFGGADVKKTSEVWSWDATHILVAGSDSAWETEPRCKTCGEATFHCNHEA